MSADIREIIEAAEAVVARWYSPKWKDEPHTAEVINRLRAALAAKTEAPTPDAAEVIEALRDLVDLTTHQRDVVRDAIAALLATIDMEPPKRETIRKAIHYPECWDVAAHPTLAAALSEVYAHFKCQQCVPAVQQGGETVAYRMEMKPGDYSFMDAKHWRYNKKMYLGARVHELTLGRLVHEPDQDEEALLLFPSIVESRLDAAPHPVMDDKSGELYQLRDQNMALLQVYDAAKSVLTYVDGALPTRGWMIDNDRSRKALSDLNIAITATKGETTP